MSRPKKEENQITETKTEVTNGSGKVKATFLQAVVSKYGTFADGKSYEIPESIFSAWEKANLVEKAKE